MKRCTWVVALALAGLAVVATSAFGAPVAPFDTNAECLECHDVGAPGAVTEIDFDVAGIVGSAPGSVDYARCRSCHLTRLPEQDHAHFGWPSCNRCHDGSVAEFVFQPAPEPLSFSPFLPDGSLPASPYYSTYGQFATAQSLSATPAQLHDIHSGKNWLADNADFAWCAPRCHQAASCESCHGPLAVSHADHALPEYPAVDVTFANGSFATMTSSTCVNPACHSLATAGTVSSTRPNCSVCHDDKLEAHGYETVDHVASDGSITGVACSGCHALDLKTEHDKASSSSAGDDCGTCHPTPRDSITSAWNQSCVTAGCHTAASSAPVHAGTTTAHAIVPAGLVCTECHEGTDLGSIHANAEVEPGKTSCLVCHSTTTVPATNDCTTCHFTYDDHPYTAESHLSDSTLLDCMGSGCHSGSRDLLAVHQEKNPAFGCNDCHQSTDPSVVSAIDSGLTTCSSCHPDISETSGHLAQHYANPPLTLNGLPQYAYWTGSAPGGAYTTDCMTCHTSNVVYEHMGVTDELGNQMRPARKDRFGDDLTCDSCHASVDPNVMGAIATGMTNCDACHVVHGPIDTIHQSTFMVDPPMNCTQCHEASLPMEHNGGFSTTTPSGRVLVGCAVCHEYYEGARGQQIEDALAAGDNKCTACHTIHGSGDHTAPSSAECAACHETADAVAIHAGSPLGGCDVCHANPTGVPTLPATTDCVNCHAEVSPTDPNHYAPASHAANNGVEGSLACTRCHSLDMKTEHAGIVTCVECHELLCVV